MTQVIDKTMTNEQLFEIYGESREVIKEILISRTMNVIKSIASKMNNRMQGNYYDDLIQEGAIGVLKAVDNYDLNRGVTFITYATSHAIGHMKKFANKQNLIKIPEHKILQANRIKGAYGKLIKNGVEPTDSEIQKETGLSLDEIRNARKIIVNMQAIYFTDARKRENNEKVSEDEFLAFLLHDEGFESSLMDKLTVTNLLSKLSKLERDIVYMKYFEEKTFYEIGNKFNLSYRYASRVNKRALRKMKFILKNKI